MRCPKCGHQDDRVLDSRATREGAAIRRRRQCLACEHRYTTFEEIVKEELRVIKRNGAREEFNRLKLEGGIKRACEKRPISLEQIHDMIDRVIEGLEGEGEISTEQIGTGVMRELLRIDDVAYIRFASVYRRFDSLNQFLQAVQEMTKQ